MTSVTTDKIIEQVKKLLALADTTRGATIEEAAAAAAKAQALLFKHNLTLAQVQEDVQEGDDYRLDTMDLGARSEWRRILFNEIAVLNFCRTIVLTGTSWSNVIGKPHNIEIVQYLYRYLSREVWSCWTSRKKQFRKKSRARYCQGCVTGIVVTLRLQRRRNEEESEDSRALVLREDQGVEEAKQRLGGPTQKHKVRKERRSKAHEAGYLDGRQVEICQGLPSGSGAPQLEHVAC